MNNLLHSILESQVVDTPNGIKEKLHSNIDKSEANFLQKLIHDFKIRYSLEVGCAMGISSLAICESITNNTQDSQHLIIDPYQSTDWKNIGINNLKRAGYRNFRLIEEPSEFALPKLVQENCSIDLAFIDGWHTFDHTLIDFFYINRLLNVGGILVIDDVKMPAVKKVARMIHNYPCYRFLSSVVVPYSTKGKAVEALKILLHPLSKLLGKRISSELMDASVLNTDRSLGLNASVIAFQKIGEDNRPWNWFENF
jgi:predicted O-methyltransferase YrrM